MRPLILLSFLWAGSAFAQAFPDYRDASVSDFAGLLTARDEAALADQLDRLNRDTGVDMKVLTLATQTDYAPDLSLEAFAHGLFERWSIGADDRNDGVLVLILRDDRAMRIELGAAYGTDWNSVAQRVVDDHFLVAFAAETYSQGILRGSEAVVADIVRPFLADQRPSARTDNTGLWILGAAIVFFSSVAGLRYVGDATVWFKRCPRCGKRALRQSRRVTAPASERAAGAGMRRERCSKCDYDEEFYFMIPRLTDASTASFHDGGSGGGSSGGGGASGRW